MTSKASERRDGPRIDLRLRVRYESAAVAGSTSTSGEAEASDVSPKGLRLESEHAVPKGTELKLSVDAGEAEEMIAIGHVTWCRPRPSPTGKTMYDVGVAFESDWLSRDRGPLGSALARIFAMNNFEPARTYERTPVKLRATATGTPGAGLEIANISMGGMQVRCKSGSIGDELRSGTRVSVDFDIRGAVHRMAAKVAWVAGARPGEQPGGPTVADSFGLEFGATAPEHRALLERVRTGQEEPTSVLIAVES